MMKTKVSSLPLKAVTAVVAVGMAAALGLSGCGASSGSSSSSAASAQSASTVTAVGSTALQPLVEAAAEQYMTENQDVSITVQGGGSGQGISQIVDGAVQIGNSDVFAEAKVANKSDVDKIVDNKVAVVGMGPIVNKDVTVKDITMADLKGIFTGKITNWSEVGGPDMKIVVINRASGSGTRATFEDAVLAGDTAPKSFKPQEQDSSGTVAKMVAETPGAISYLAFSYFTKDFTALSVDGVAPEAKNVETNKWKIWSYEHMYTAASPDQSTQDFIDYMMSDEVQKNMVVDNGYISIADMKVERSADGKIKNL